MANHSKFELIREPAGEGAAGGRRPRSVQGVSDMSRRRASIPRTANLIYKDLLDDIVTMRLRPNDRISEKDLLERFSVSRTPLREAILRLADEGLLVIFPQVGTFVARIPVRLLRESIMIRRALELVLVEAACEKRGKSDIAALDRNLLQMERLSSTSGLEEFHRNDNEFHALIGGIADYPTVVATTEHSRTQIDRYRVLTLPQKGRLDRVLAAHRAVRDGIAAGDPAAACAAMSHQLGQMLDEVEALENLDRDYFYDDRDSDRTQP